MSCILILQIVSFQGIALTAYLPYLKGRGFTRSFDENLRIKKARCRHNNLRMLFTCIRLRRLSLALVVRLKLACIFSFRANTLFTT